MRVHATSFGLLTLSATLLLQNLLINGALGLGFLHALVLAIGHGSCGVGTIGLGSILALFIRGHRLVLA